MAEPNATMHDNRTAGILVPLAGIALLAGVFVRFWHLGGAPLAVDEYYFGMSILNIVERGLPAFPCGGFYTRGILLQYLTVPLLGGGATLEFAVRFWPAVASVLTIAGVWRLARSAGGIALAAAAVILTSLSVWEVEFARFGRMYAPFQAAFVWYVYFQVRHLAHNRDADKWWALLISGISVFIYAGASFLLILNFLPLLWRGRKRSILHLALSVMLLVAGVRIYSADLRYFGLPESELPPPTGGELGPSLPVNLPPLPELWLPVVLCGAAVSVILLWKLKERVRFDHPAAVYWILCILGVAFGLFGLAAGLYIAGVLLGLPGAPGRGKPNIRGMAGILLPIFLLWGALLTALNLSGGAPARESVKRALQYLLDFPDVYYLVLHPWLVTIPATTIVLIVLIAPVLLAALRDIAQGAESRMTAIRYLLGTTILLVMLAASFRQPYSITRYTYFLYPLLLILAATGMLRIARLFPWPSLRRVGPIIALLVVFLATEDFSAAHLVGINQPTYRYRTVYENRLAAHYYPRWDFRSPSEYVNEHLRPEDRVIAFDQPVTHYLERTDGIFVRSGTSIHELTWACGGRRHLWSNASLLDENAEVRRLIETTDSRVWLIVRTDAVAWRDPLEETLVREYGLASVFDSQDGHLSVYLIPERQRRSWHDSPEIP